MMRKRYRRRGDGWRRSAGRAATALLLGLGQAGAQPAAGEGVHGPEGFSISVDGRALAGTPQPRDPARAADVAAAAAGIDIRHDGLGGRRLLNVATADLRSAYRAGERLTFRTSVNYPAFVSRAEIRIIDLGRRGRPTIATIPVAGNGTAHWVMPDDGSGRFAYLLRVYDGAGRFDETVASGIRRSEKAFATHRQVGTVAVAPGEGEDRTARRGIPLHGGMITVSGSGGVPGGTARVMGESVPVDGAGRFVISRILPAGDHAVTVEVGGRRITRHVSIPEPEWFRTGIIDITAGLREGGAGSLDNSYLDGRIAFYLKGRTRGGFTITGSLDTGDGPIEGIFSRLDDKDPRRVLERLREDGTELYPTYGDDSTFFDDTPTAGRVYLRAESDTLRLTWGDFKAGMTGAGLLQNTRDLYGAELRYRSRATTDQGEPRFSAVAYAASPDTLSQRDILRGTGGSVYFLTRQDITAGSVTLSVQTVDRDTGRVVSSRRLSPGVDYTIDHIQGLVMLTSPLESGAADGGLISDGGAEHDVNLVAQYEYTPSGSTPDDLALGGRIEAWAGDRLRLGATVMRENVAGADQDMQGVDLRYQLSEGSHAEVEYARTAGPGLARSSSTDGGLTIVSSTGLATAGAGALRFDSRFDLRDLGVQRDGFVELYHERKQAGFSTLSEDITADQTLSGGAFEVALSPRLSFAGDVERFTQAGGNSRDEAELRLGHELSERWTIEGGLAFVDKITLGDPSQTGQRTDAAVRVSHRRSDDLELYAFGQGTLSARGTIARNDRLGAGLDAQLSERLRLEAEASGGTAGPGGALRLSYAPSADSELYLGYTLDPTRAGAGGPLRDRGRVVLGGSYRASERVTAYSEMVLDRPGNQTSLSRMFGVNYTPTSAWTLGASIELGEVRDATSGDFDRLALSLGAAYARDEGLSWRARLEYRNEDGVGTARDRDTWALAAGFTNRVNDDWRLLGSIDALISDSAQGDFRNGEYVNASLGYAYRPIGNEKLNLLFRYRYLRDLPGEDQVGADGTTNQPLQVSNILSVNGSYDLSPRLTIGGKLGYRKSQVAPRGTSAFTDNTAVLLALRLDWHLTGRWDLMGEGRALFTRESGTTELGAVLTAYRHLNDRVKLGVGVEWGSVSDDLTSISHEGGARPVPESREQVLIRARGLSGTAAPDLRMTRPARLRPEREPVSRRRGSRGGFTAGAARFPGRCRKGRGLFARVPSRHRFPP